jgi:hypothetical protein
VLGDKEGKESTSRARLWFDIDVCSVVVHNVITGLFLLCGFFVVLLVRSGGDYRFPGMSVYRQGRVNRLDSDRGWSSFQLQFHNINIGVFNDFISLSHFVCDRVCSYTQRTLF